jgi:hypothetical protein
MLHFSNIFWLTLMYPVNPIQDNISLFFMSTLNPKPYGPNTMNPKLLIINKIYSPCVWLNHLQTWEPISLGSHMLRSTCINYLVMYVALICRSMAYSNCITSTCDKARGLSEVKLSSLSSFFFSHSFAQCAFSWY